jgi:hypothetical protein
LPIRTAKLSPILSDGSSLAEGKAARYGCVAEGLGPPLGVAGWPAGGTPGDQSGDRRGDQEFTDMVAEQSEEVGLLNELQEGITRRWG